MHHSNVLDIIDMNSEGINYSGLYFFILLFLSGIAHHFYKKSPPTTTADGSIIMAIGIFSLDALQKMPFVTPGLTQLIALELLIIWMYLIKSYTRQYLNGYFAKMVTTMLSQFGIGTWVAGSAVLAILFLQAFPSFTFVVCISTFLALVIWLGYIIVSSYNLWLIVVKRLKLHTGIILLPTVSTQSIVLLAYSLFVAAVPLLIYQILIVLGYLLYLFGFFVIARHTLWYRSRHFIVSWHNTNSIIHGALSISGLAGTSTHACNDVVIISTWLGATSFLILNEGISFIKSIYRLKVAGFIKGILVYNGSQWARVFTLGMYYAFNRSLLEHQVYTNQLIKQIVTYGQYGVFIILLFELFNYFYNQFDFKQVPTITLTINR